MAVIFRTAYKKACYLPWNSHVSLFALCNYPTCLLKIYDVSFGYAPQGSSGMSYCNQTPFPLREGWGLGTRLARVGKDQVGNGVKETINHNSQALMQTTEKGYKGVRFSKSSHRSKSFAVISWNCCRSTAVFARVESLNRCHRSPTVSTKRHRSPTLSSLVVRFL